MKMKYEFSSEQYIEIKNARKANRDKQTDKRLEVLELRCEGKSLNEIATATGFHRSHVSNLIRKYFEEGLEAVSEKHYPGNRRNMSFEEEARFLEEYRDIAEAGQMLDIHEIAKAYENAVGHRNEHDGTAYGAESEGSQWITCQILYEDVRSICMPGRFDPSCKGRSYGTDRY